MKSTEMMIVTNWRTQALVGSIDFFWLLFSIQQSKKVDSSVKLMTTSHAQALWKKLGVVSLGQKGKANKLWKMLLIVNAIKFTTYIIDLQLPMFLVAESVWKFRVVCLAQRDFLNVQCAKVNQQIMQKLFNSLEASCLKTKMNKKGRKCLSSTSKNVPSHQATTIVRSDD